MRGALCRAGGESGQAWPLCNLGRKARVHVGMETIIVVVLVLLVVGALPMWPYWRGQNYGYMPSLGGVILLLVVLWLLFGSGHHLSLR